MRRTWRTVLIVALFNSLLLSPWAYVFYKLYDPSVWPMDTRFFMPLAQDWRSDVGSPHQYRILTPLVVGAMDLLPGTGTPCAYSADPEEARLFLHYVLLNLICIGVTSGLLYGYLRSHVSAGWAWFGSVLYMMSFHVLVVHLSPTADSSAHMFLMVLIVLLERRRPLVFTLLATLSWLNNEKMIIALVLWILVGLPGSCWKARYLLGLFPGLVVYALFVVWRPAVSAYAYRDVSYLISRVWAFLSPDTYSLSFLAHVFVSQPFFLWALAIYGVMAWRDRHAPCAIPRELLVFVLLMWVGITTGIGNNTGRLAFFAFPAMVLFQARVYQSAWERWSGEPTGTAETVVEHQASGS